MSLMKLEYSAASHRGGRRSNEDSLRIGEDLRFFNLETNFSLFGARESEGPQLMCVCDGIGGADMGDMASMLAVSALDLVSEDPDLWGKPLEHLVVDIAEAAHEQVTAFFQRFGRPGGCTMTLAAVRDGEFALLNIGDSPALLWKHNTAELVELSCRHNLEWHKRRMDLEPEPRDASCLMRFLGKRGCTAATMAHVVTGQMEPGDRMLLCTDGVTNGIPLDQIGRALAQGVQAGDLVKEAASMPGADNCTAILFAADSAAGNTQKEVP